eukprot:scaffold179622_cov39-Prasinocladus_malaysianus.AAC.1
MSEKPRVPRRLNGAFFASAGLVAIARCQHPFLYRYSRSKCKFGRGEGGISEIAATTLSPGGAD